MSLPFTCQQGADHPGACQREPRASGYYMLFLVNSAGVPSVAPFVRLPSPPDASHPRLPHGCCTWRHRHASLTWTPSTDNTGVAHYNMHRAPRPVLCRLPQQDRAVDRRASRKRPAGTYFYVVTAQDIAGNVRRLRMRPRPRPADVTAPTAAITAPADRAQVSGLVTIRGCFRRCRGGRREVRGRWHSYRLRRSLAPLRVTWNSAIVSNDVHTLTADARDSAGPHADARSV